MTLLRLILASLWFHRRMHAATACGVAVGAAVLTGALLVGDSMRGSLHDLVLQRLGSVDYVLAPQQFFRCKLADELADGPEFAAHFAAAVPGIVSEASVEKADRQAPARAGGVQVIGCDDRFAKLGRGGPTVPLGRRDVVLNQPLAEQLRVGPGDDVILRLPRREGIPADSPLGKKSDTVVGVRLKVAQIIPCEGLGRFGLRASQRLPRNAYVALATLQQEMEQADRCNVVFVAGKDGQQPTPAEYALLGGLLKPKLADYGLRVEKTKRGYFDVTSDHMILPPGVEKAVHETVGPEGGDSVLTYLAITLACGDREIPYSTISALKLSDQPPLGPMLDQAGEPIPPLSDKQIVLNSWAAQQLQAKPGDTIRVTFFEPESTHGKIQQRQIELVLAAVTPLEGAAADPALTPSVPGVTDQLSMGDWDPPFPFDHNRVRKQDDEYWRDHRATPKAFVSPETGRRYWSSRFGTATSCRIVPREGITRASIEGKLKLDPAGMGFVFQPVKMLGLAASAGTTPFEVLFLGFSFFLIASAVMLVALMFRLGVDRRAAELGILKAVGFQPRRLSRILLAEGVAVAVLGSAVGMLGGVGYATLMLLGLRTWWLAAVTTPFLTLHIGKASLAAGFISGVIVAILAIRGSVRRIRHIAPLQLLAGQTFDAGPTSRQSSRLAGPMAVAALVLAAALGVFAWRLGEEARAGAFFAAGMLVLAACLTWVASRLRSGATGPAVKVGGGNLRRLAARNAARNPGRSTLCIALVASAVFLMVAVSAFRIAPSGPLPNLHSGDGGFALMAESDQPIYRDLNTPEGRAEFGFKPDEEALLARCTLIAMRVQAGDDASCLNLYRPQRPRILAVPEQLAKRDGFVWAAARTVANPWQAFQSSATSETGLPVVLEKNTANYSLHLWKGLGESFDTTGPQGGPLKLDVAGLLSGSIFQGDLLMGEKDFLQAFPAVSGYRVFLIETPAGETAHVREILEHALGDYGFTTETTAQRLAEFTAVQNTYLSTFQSLGGLGLLLGTLGLGAVQLRNVFERRGELALMRAAGFRKTALARLVLEENAILLILGLGIGVLAAAIAVLPHLVGQGASIPWRMLAVSLGLVFAAGLAASGMAVRVVLTAPLTAELRRDL